MNIRAMNEISTIKLSRSIANPEIIMPEIKITTNVFKKLFLFLKNLTAFWSGIADKVIEIRKIATDTKKFVFTILLMILNTEYIKNLSIF